MTWRFLALFPRYPSTQSSVVFSSPFANPIDLFFHVLNYRVLEQGKQLVEERKAWQSAATQSFQNKRARSISRARSKSLSAKEAHGRGLIRQPNGGVGVGTEAAQAFEFLAERTLLGNQARPPTIHVHGPPKRKSSRENASQTGSGTGRVTTVTSAYTHSHSHSHSSHAKGHTCDGHHHANGKGHTAKGKGKGTTSAAEMGIAAATRREKEQALEAEMLKVLEAMRVDTGAGVSASVMLPSWERYVVRRVDA